MLSFSNKKLSTESYKGVRDFYPADQAVQNYIFSTMRKAVEAWGYVEYGASVLEPSDLYKSKTSEEIVNEQTYSFIDRAGREVTLRPEMTPTVARMIAQRLTELPSPIRWYSIPNVFRYEKPQKGRLREHWQLNVDLFGVTGLFADAEIISVADAVMQKFGAARDTYKILLNSRLLLDDVLRAAEIALEQKLEVCRVLDRKEKMSAADFKNDLEKLVGEEKGKKLIEFLYFGEALLTMLPASEEAKNISKIIDTLRARGITNVVYTPTLTRGFDYYTGTVFEVFDTSPENNRSLFGGGRYDGLVSAFRKENVPAIGFGMGDVTIRDFLDTHKLMPVLESKTDVWIAPAPNTPLEDVYKFADALRSKQVNVGVDISGKKIGDMIQGAEKRSIPLLIVIGEEELKTKQYKVRRLKDRVEKETRPDNIVQVINELKSGN